MNQKTVIGMVTIIVFFGLLGSGQVLAEKYPAKPISIIVPYAPGGGTDANARIIEKYAPKYLGQPVAIINKPGAGGAVGYTELSKAKPDGYTIGYTNLPNMVQLVVEGKVHFKIDDFEPIAGQVKENKLIAVSAKSPFKTIEDLIAYAKANPSKLNGATSGANSHNEMVLQAFCNAADIQMVLIPLKGDSGMKTALLGGHTDVMAIGISGFDTEQFRPLMLCDKKRNPELPNVPTSFEKGFNLDMATNRVLQAPKGTPKEIIAYLEDKFMQMFSDPEYLGDMKKIGGGAAKLTSKEVMEVIRQDNEFLSKNK